MQNSFTYCDFRLDDDRQDVAFTYSLIQDGTQYDFTEKLRFPVVLPDTADINRALRALHLALGISYYKTFMSPVMNVPYTIDQAEADFWNTVWRHGLGEFLYVNKLDPANLATFSPQAGIDFGAPEGEASGQGALLGIGGGKDSIVAGELLKQLGIEIAGFVMATGEQRGQAQAVATAMRMPLSAVERTLDKTLLTVQELPGAHKGHVPISLVFGLVGITLALAQNKRYVIVANEASASLPRITWEHGAVNHQWSKSLEFERALQEFAAARIAPVTYFSAVRPLTSVAIAKIFSQFPQYFEVFTSDNSVFRIDPKKRPAGLWSLESPKSLSSYMLLAPWVSEAELRRIFHRDFLNETSLETLFLELTGQQGEPPLDCVGTVDELVLSLNLAYLQHKFTSSYLMQLAVDRGVISNQDWQTATVRELALQPDQAFPAELAEQLNGVMIHALES